MTARVPAGVVTGGQFAAQVRPEAAVALDVPGPIPDTTDARPVASGAFDGIEWRESVTSRGQHVREAFADGRSVSAVTFDVYDENRDGWATCENTVDVEYMLTDPGYRGRGLNRTLLRSLAADHPGKSFVTENFERPTARRAWEDALGHADAMTGDGEFGCRWCCAELADPDDYDDPADAPTDATLCGKCDQVNTAHVGGEHAVQPPSDCWTCDVENRAVVAP